MRDEFNDIYEEDFEDEGFGDKPEMLKEAIAIIEKVAKTRKKSLDLSGLYLKSIPKEAFELTFLEDLNISNNPILTIDSPLAKLTNLKVVDYENTYIEKDENYGYIEAVLRINFALNKNETELDLSKLSLEYLPESISLLKNIEVLDIRGNSLLEIPKPVFNLKKLIEFYYGGNDSDSNLGSILALCRVNEAKKYDLKEIELSELGLSSIPNGVEECQGLEKIDLYGNFISELDERILKITNLTDLYLGGNRIKDIPPNIDNLKNLVNLSLYGNLIEELPDNIGNLEKLEELLLNDNNIKELPLDIGNLKNLKTLALHNNSISEIPSTLLNLTRLEYFEIKDNGINIIQEVYDKKPLEQIKYIIDLQKASKPLHEAKVIFIGSGFVGKTSLVNKITTNQTGNPEKTNGIDIHKWKVFNEKESDIRLNIWDFGGQEIMHATHKFFMTNRSIYVIVTSPRVEDKQGESELEYWLKLVQSYTKKESVPIIVVVNKCDVHKVDIGRRELKLKYPNIVDIIETSCTKNIGIEQLKESIKLSVKFLTHIDELLPITYFRVKEKLEKINKDYIQYNEYSRICKFIDKGFDDINMKGLVGLLHDLGIMLNFSNDRRLYETQVLNPEWVTNGVYQIITSPTLIEKKGVLNYSDVDAILDDSKYPTVKEKSYILDIMERFELCFQFDNKIDHYFIPGGFPVDPPAVKWRYNLKNNIKFIYKYDVLPNSIISRFMVKVHKQICGKFYWKNGVVINDGECFAMIKSDSVDRMISIEVDGGNDKRKFLTEIRNLLESIHESYGGLKIERQIPIDDEVFVNYDNLVIYERENEKTIFIPQLRKRFYVKELLEGVEELKEKPVKFKSQNIFLSYCHKDETWKEQFEVHLKSLERQELITSWNDRMIPPGKEWEKEIDEYLKKSEVIILMISPEFIASEFCYSVEMNTALERHERDECVVIPVITRPCNWTSLPFSKLQALPKDGKPISLWRNVDEAFNEVVKGVLRII